MRPLQPPAETLVVHAEFVQRLAHALAGRDGDDLVQETWVNALAADARRIDNVRGWLAAIAGNLWRNRRRSDERRARRESCAEAPPSTPAVDVIAEREEVRQRTVAAVLMLPEPLREVVLLRFYEGLDTGAIARRLQRPASTVRSQLQTALQRLRRRLDQEHGDQRAAWVVPLSGWKHALTSAAVVAMRVGWPLRVGAIVVLLAIVLLFTPDLIPVPQGPVPIAPVQVADAGPHEDPSQVPANERQTAQLAPVAAAARGPEDLWGRVVAAADGAPVANADVQLLFCDADEFGHLDLDEEYKKQVAVLGQVRTDRDGGFAFRVTRARQHRLQVRAAGFAPTTAFECTGGSEVVVRVAAGAVIEGVVREKAGNKPLEDVLVRAVLAEPYLELASVRTASDGAFRFTELPATAVGVSVRDARFADSYQHLDLQPARVHQVEFELSAGYTAHGRVTDEVTGAPIAGARVSGSKSFDFCARTDDEGRYRLPGLDGGMGGLLFASAEGYCMKWGEQAGVELNAAIDLVMVRPGSVRGRFVGAAGAGASVALAGAGSSFLISIGEATDWQRAVVGADGRFSITGLDPGFHYSLYARGTGLGTRVLVLPRAVPAGEVLDLGDVVMRPAGGIEGIVVGKDGTVFAGATIHLLGQNDDAWQLLGQRIESVRPNEFLARSVHSASDGAFRIGGLARGSYELSVRLPGHGFTAKFGPYEVQDGEIRSAVRLEIDFGRMITGTLRTADGGAPSKQLQVIMLLRQKGVQQSMRVGADGSFRFARLVEGEYTISAVNTPAGWVLPVQRGVLAESKEVQLTLQRATTIEGTVLDAQDHPIRGMVICWFEHGGEDQLAGADGRFRIEVPHDFVGKITASDPADEQKQATAENVPAGTKDLVLRLR